MSDNSISDDELAALLEGPDDFNGSAFSDEPPAPRLEAPKVERSLSQAEIDALFKSMGGG